jgi:hypothetical protein
MATIWFGALAQLIGMPIAWLRLRRTDAWQARPRDLRRIDLLAGFIREAVDVTIVWTFLMILGVLGGALLGWPGVVAGAMILLFAGPLLFVPLIVLQLDVDCFPDVVERARRR